MSRYLHFCDRGCGRFVLLPLLPLSLHSLVPLWPLKTCVGAIGMTRWELSRRMYLLRRNPPPLLSLSRIALDPWGDAK